MDGVTPLDQARSCQRVVSAGYCPDERIGGEQGQPVGLRAGDEQTIERIGG